MQHTNSLDAAPERKLQHLDLARQAQVSTLQQDRRFYYEPLLAVHPTLLDRAYPSLATNFLGKKLKAPLWISSMTGGAARAGELNRRLAQAARTFGLGMGLGSCRQLLSSNDYLADFSLRPLLGDDLPLMANLGVAQIEEVFKTQGSYQAIHQMIERLDADGLVIHVNPLQEFFQPEGDQYQQSPLATIEHFLATTTYPVIVKEVGQGIGPQGLRALAQLPLAAIDFAAFGGTNFARLEQLRAARPQGDVSAAFVGHNVDEMTDWMIDIKKSLGPAMQVKHVIVSGGIRTALDGYFYTQRLAAAGIPAIYAMGAPLIHAAEQGQEALEQFLSEHLRSLAVAQAYLRVRA